MPIKEYTDMLSIIIQDDIYCEQCGGITRRVDVSFGAALCYSCSVEWWRDLIALERRAAEQERNGSEY